MDRSWTTGRIRARIALAIVCLAGLAVSSQSLAADARVETIADNLKGPCALAVRPGGSGTSEVFVAECGAGRVVRFSGNKAGSGKEVITGFARQAADNNTNDIPGAAGVQSLFFLDRTRLVVTGGADGGKPFIRLYEVGDSSASLKAEDFKQEVELPNDDDRVKSIRSFHDLARTQPNDKVSDVLVTAATGERRSAGLWKVAVRANTLGDIAPLGNAKSSNDREAVGGAAIADSGYIVIASGMQADSQPTALIFLNPIDGRTVFRIRTDLERIVALAYSPLTGNLFATDSPLLSKASGIYRLDDASELGKSACKSVKVADVSRPTSLGFAADGTLYVTALGVGNNSGMLLKLTGAH